MIQSKRSQCLLLRLPSLAEELHITALQHGLASRKLPSWFILENLPRTQQCSHLIRGSCEDECVLHPLISSIMQSQSFLLFVSSIKDPYCLKMQMLFFKVNISVQSVGHWVECNSLHSAGLEANRTNCPFPS